MEDYYVKIPNCYVQVDVEAKYGVNHNFQIVYLLVGRYRSPEGFSNISADMVCNFYRIKDKRTKVKILRDVIEALNYMAEKGLIEILSDLNNVKSDTCINLRIISETFEPSDNYTEVNVRFIDYLKSIEEDINRQNLLAVLLYMLSFINGYEESGYFRSIDFMISDTGLSRYSVFRSLDVLTTAQSDQEPLFLKGTPKGSLDYGRVPNVYVLNHLGAENLLAWQIRKVEKALRDPRTDFYSLRSGQLGVLRKF